MSKAVQGLIFLFSCASASNIEKCTRDGECQIADAEATAMEVTMLQRSNKAAAHIHSGLESRRASILAELKTIETQLSMLEDVSEESEQNGDGHGEPMPDPDDDDDYNDDDGTYNPPSNRCCSRRRLGGECASRRRRHGPWYDHPHGDTECGHCDNAGCFMDNDACPKEQKCVGNPNPYGQPPTCQCHSAPPPCAAQGNWCGADNNVHHKCCPPVGRFPDGTESKCSFKVGHKGAMTCQYKTESGCKAAGGLCGKFGTQMGKCCNGLTCSDDGESSSGEMRCQSGFTPR